MSSPTTLTVPADHPAFAGHFPGHPVVPGVVLLDAALAAVAADLGLALTGCRIAACKFVGAVRPGDPLELEFERSDNGRIHFALRSGDRPVATAVCEFASPAAPGAPAPGVRPAIEPIRPAPRSAEWANRAERGSRSLLRLMTWISLHAGRPASRPVLYVVAFYFFLFAPTARRHAHSYLRRALGREPTLRDSFRHILSFASTIHDRVFFLNGRYDLFDVAIEGEAYVQDAHDRHEGAFLMGAHLGSFEVTRAVGHRQVGLDVAMAMYADNARKINAALDAINPALNADIIELGHLAAMLEISRRLEAGSFVGILGDRSPGNEPTQDVEFLGAPAAFPTGPMRAAAMLRRRVYFMAGLYLGGNRYRAVFEPVADFSAVTRAGRDAAVRDALHVYAAVLERHCRACPYNWFNFFDFWKRPASAAPHPAAHS